LAGLRTRELFVRRPVQQEMDFIEKPDTAGICGPIKAWLAGAEARLHVPAHHLR
jgi:hypothetical protein